MALLEGVGDDGGGEAAHGAYSCTACPFSTSAKRAFYNADGPWRRRGVFEALGSRRYSQPALHGMDARLEALLDRDGGVFLEAGAHDGYTQSNTYYLERFRGWTGVLVEAVPELHAKAARRARARTSRSARSSRPRTPAEP